MANTTRNRVIGNNGSAPGLELVGGPAPEFDFSNLSWKESKEMDYARTKIRKGEAEADVVTMEQGFNEMQQFLAKITVGVPRAWLVADAPEEIDWSDPDSFDYLRGNRMQDLMRAYMEAMQDSQKK